MKQKLLIVDDEQGIVDMMKAWFSPRYEVLTAYSGEEALKRVREQPDLILLDIGMPGMDGLSVCRTMREYVACPILFLTARIEAADKITGGQSAGVAGGHAEKIKIDKRERIHYNEKVDCYSHEALLL